MSTRPQRIEVISRVERRRRWSHEQKQAIVSESVAGHLSISARSRASMASALANSTDGGISI
jgi:transposase-like protein